MAYIVLDVFYYTIGNFRPELRSTHCCIQLIAVVTHPLLKKYGFREILNPFVNDVKMLYEVQCIIFRLRCYLGVLGWHHCGE